MLSSAGLHSTTYLYWLISGTLRLCYVTICNLTPMSKDIYVCCPSARIPRPWSNTVPPRTVLQRTRKLPCQDSMPEHCGRGRHCRRCEHHTTSPEQHGLYIRKSRNHSRNHLRPVSRVSTWTLHRASVKRRRLCAYKYLRIYKNHTSACKNPKTMVQHGTSSHSPAENAPEGELPCQNTRPKHRGRGRHCKRCPHHSTSRRQHELYIRRSRDRSRSHLRPDSRVSTWNLHRASVKRRRPCAYKYLRIYKNHISACKNPKTMAQHGASSYSPAENAPEGELPCQNTRPKHRGRGRHCRRRPHHSTSPEQHELYIRSSRDHSRNRLRPVSRSQHGPCTGPQ
jgi:hypothetical protein